MPTLRGYNLTASALGLPVVRDGGPALSLPVGAFAVHVTSIEARGLQSVLSGMQVSGAITYNIVSDEDASVVAPLNEVQSLSGLRTRLFTVAVLAAKAVDDVHTAFLGNVATNSFPGAFTSPAVHPRNIIATFEAGWTGGNITLYGTDQFDRQISEVLVSNAGSTRVGLKTFKTITAATKGAVGAAKYVKLGQGDKLAVMANITSDSVGTLTKLVGGAWTREAVTLEPIYDTFTPTTVPDAATAYELVVNVL